MYWYVFIEDMMFIENNDSKNLKAQKLILFLVFRKMRVYSDEEDSFDERMENSRKNLLKDEIRCLELTLAKRKAQLREADRLLKECNTDLKYARDEVRIDLKTTSETDQVGGWVGVYLMLIEPFHEKKRLWDFRPGKTQTGLLN